MRHLAAACGLMLAVMDASYVVKAPFVPAQWGGLTQAEFNTRMVNACASGAAAWDFFRATCPRECTTDASFPYALDVPCRIKCVNHALIAV